MKESAGESARVVSVNVGLPHEVTVDGRTTVTGIFKSPVEGPVRAAGVNLDGDDQADRTVHGGPTKAVYAFPIEHYESWRIALPESEFEPLGAFGENLTTSGLLEEGMIVGSRFRCGDVELVVTEPRMPCFKLGIRLGDKTALKRMLETGHTGFYFGIVREGMLQAGDAFEKLGEPENGIPVSALTDLYSGKRRDRTALETAHEAPGVPETWRAWIEKRLASTE